MSRPRTIITKSELAAILKLSPGRVSQLANTGLPTRGDGKVNRDEAVAWYRANVREGSRKRGPKLKVRAVEPPPKPVSLAPPVSERATTDSGTVETFQQAVARKESALADLRTMEARKMKGELLDVAEVREAWSRHIAAAKNRLLLLESKVPAECMAAVKKEVRAALVELSEYNPAATAAQEQI